MVDRYLTAYCKMDLIGPDSIYVLPARVVSLGYVYASARSSVRFMDLGDTHKEWSFRPSVNGRIDPRLKDSM